MHDDSSLPPAEAEADRRAAELLAHLPTPAAGAEARVAKRLARSLEGERRPTRTVWPYAVAGGSTFLAAAAALIVVLWPAPAPTAGAGELASVETWGARDFEGVSLSYRGEGDVGGAAKAPRIEWTSGVLHVEVTPNQGLDVRVSTREADIRVVGTGFTVTRDALGTRVDVRHGIVETRCADGEARRLLQGDSVTCAPRSATGLLGRAQSLHAQGAPLAEVLAALDAGAGAEPSAVVADELDALRIQVLVDSGRQVEALTVAEALLRRGGGLRRDEVLSLVPELARPLGGCAVAAPWLAELAPDAASSCP